MRRYFLSCCLEERGVGEVKPTKLWVLIQHNTCINVVPECQTPTIDNCSFNNNLSSFITCLLHHIIITYHSFIHHGLCSETDSTACQKAICKTIYNTIYILSWCCYVGQSVQNSCNRAICVDKIVEICPTVCCIKNREVTWILQLPMHACNLIYLLWVFTWCI